MSQRYKIETPCSLPDKCMGIDCNSKPVKLLRIEPFSFEDCFYYCEPCLLRALLSKASAIMAAMLCDKTCMCSRCFPAQSFIDSTEDVST